MNESLRSLQESVDIFHFMELYVKKIQVIEDNRIKVFVVTIKRREEKTATGGSLREAVLTLMRGDI